MSSRSSSVDKRDMHENDFIIFLLERIKQAGGSLPLQQITGHLSELSYNAIGSSKSDLLYFLKKHDNFFSVHGNVVKIFESRSSNNGGYDSDSSSIEPQSSLPSNIRMGKGVIIKIFPEFGFIKAKEPVKTEVYFKAVNFGNKDIDLTDSLYVGAMVYFHAKKKNSDDSRSKYSATKVWKVDENDMHSSIIDKKSRKNRDTGLYDPITLDSEGVIQNVFPNLGFIAVKGDENNTVFFHKNRLLKYDNVVDLTKVLSKGDIVEFTAHRSTKQDAKARWEATKVWKKTSKIKEKSLVAKSNSIHSNQSSVSKSDMKSKSNDKEMIKNQRGKICPRSQGAVIKFGQNELADGDASVYYISGCQVTDISWEFSEGDDVYFDAVKIKSAPGWKAVLVWVGEKPDIVLPTCLGDFSEFTDDETEDNLSNHISFSSNSSVKSGSSSSKIKKMPKETSRLSNFSANREDKKSNMKEELPDSSSRYGSQISLSSSVTSKSSQRSRKEKNNKNSSLNGFSNAENKSVSCWGDSPYPVEKNCENISSDNYTCDLATTVTHSRDSKVSNEEALSKSEHSGSLEEKSENVRNDEFSFSLKETKDEKKVNSESVTKINKTASVKKFKCLEGKIMKVYSNFAQVKGRKLEKIVSFFWNNFYVNGVSVEELEVEDLKQVLKVGDTIHFNYFEIVDDLGQNWQKVSLAWKDSKPKKVIEMSPEDFIRENSLSVSMKYETINNIDESDKEDNKEERDEDNKEESDKEDNKEESNAVRRKYLTAVEDLGPNKLVNKAYVESCSEDKSLSSAGDLNVSKLPNSLSSLDYKMMSSAIIKILKKDLFPTYSKVDLSVITEEIINVVLENHDTKKCDAEFCRTLSPNDNYVNITSDITCTNCGKTLMLNSSKDMNTKTSEVQTIITGEIIAQNIFTEC